MGSSSVIENLKRSAVNYCSSCYPLKKRRIKYEPEGGTQETVSTLGKLETPQLGDWEPENLSTKAEDLRITSHHVKCPPSATPPSILHKQAYGPPHIQYNFPVQNVYSTPFDTPRTTKIATGLLEPISLNPPAWSHENQFTNFNTRVQFFPSPSHNYTRTNEFILPHDTEPYIAPLRSIQSHLSPQFKSINPIFHAMEVKREGNRLSELRTATQRIKVETNPNCSGVFRRESVITHSKNVVTGFHGGISIVDRDAVSRSSCDSGVSSPGGSSSHSTMSGESRSPTNARYQCTHCAKSYSTVAGLSKHIQFYCTFQITKTFVCKDCNKVYTSLGALKMHIRTHTLHCKCTLCPKSFSRPWLLQGHLRTHTEEKPFVCQHCHRAFSDRSNLRAHLQTHSEVKKYSCNCCAKTFSRMSLLSKHEESGCSTGST